MLDFGPHFDTLNMTSLNLYLNRDQTDTSSRSRVTECRAIFQLAKTASFNRGKVNQPRLGSGQGPRFALSRDREFRDSVNHISLADSTRRLVHITPTHSFVPYFRFYDLRITALVCTPVFFPSKHLSPLSKCSHNECLLVCTENLRSRYT